MKHIIREWAPDLSEIKIIYQSYGTALTAKQVEARCQELGICEDDLHDQVPEDLIWTCGHWYSLDDLSDLIDIYEEGEQRQEDDDRTYREVQRGY